MNTTQFNSRHKAIKMPEGAAGEYAKYSCNLYKGCRNECTYCFNNRWKWGNVPTLKKCFKNEQHALEVFEKELQANLPELQKHGLFFTFTSDPCLKETIKMTDAAIRICRDYGVLVKILTKRADWVGGYITADNKYAAFPFDVPENIRKNVLIGFTLTGHDELEPNASTNAERIEAMRKLHNAGFKTWASIEPIIDIQISMKMIACSAEFCNLFKVGIGGGKKYVKNELRAMINYSMNRFKNNKFYFKDTLLAAAGIDRSELPENCVTRDYNIFNL